MQFIRGNLALREHKSNGRRVFLFISTGDGSARFEGELELITVDYFLGKDESRNERTAIRFFLKRVGSVVDFPIEYLNFPSIKNREQLLLDIPNITERRGLVTSRVGQGAYRKSILFRWDFKCAVTNFQKNQILVASHIVPWSSSTNEERLDVDNGIFLSPTYDALFDQHLISFENSGKIILSKALLSTDYHLLGVNGDERIKKLSRGNHFYLERHRDSLLKLV